MSHILKKMQIAGGGKRRNEPKPPIYKPPVMGELQYGASYSYSEILDLVSDGPIEGLCNRFGRVMEGLGMLQGIYLDDTPVAVTQGTEDLLETNPDIVTDTLEIMPSQLSNSVGTGIKNCQLFFKALNEQKRKSSSGLITALSEDGTIGPILDGEVVTLPDVNMMMIREREHSSRCSTNTPTNRSRRGVYYRAYINKEGTDAKRFYLMVNGTSKPEFDGDDNSVYRSDNLAEGSIDAVGWMDNEKYNLDDSFPADVAGQTAKFAIGYGGDNMGFVGDDGYRLWRETERYLARVANGDKPSATLKNTNNNVCAMTTISRLYNENALYGVSSLTELPADFDHDNKNAYQGALARRALRRAGWFREFGVQLRVTPGDYSRLRFEEWMENSDDNKSKNWTVIVKVDEDNPNLEGKKLIDAEGELIPMFTYPYGLNNGWNLYLKMRDAGIRILDFTCPVVDKEGVATGKMYGFLLFSFRPSIRTDDLRCGDGRYGEGTNFAIPKIVKDLFMDLDSFKYSKETIPEQQQGNTFDIINQKYNYTNVLAEFREGAENQEPFDFFKAVFIDHKYAAPLFGPFSASRGSQPQRISQNQEMLSRGDVLKKGSAHNYNLTVGGDGLPELEGSDDERVGGDNTTRDYGSWSKNSLVRWDELAIPLTHYIYNPNVRRCFITLNISSLSDTLIKEVDNVGGADATNNDLKIGTKFPTVLNIRVETGSVGKDGSEHPKYTHTYRIVALVEGSTLIDIGNPDYKADKEKEYVVELDNSSTNLAMPFRLPQAVITKELVLNDQGTDGIQADSIDQDSVEKRYIRVTKLSYETNSILLSKEVALDKVTEIIDVDLPYPFSAIIGTKLDSRAFGAIPARSFDCKLKKVRLPSNYHPQSPAGRDKRYWSSKAAFNSLGTRSQLVYEGDWDGTFHEELRWTDNPAWILYDMLVNERYGMGTHIDKDTINIWQLYEIGRFCDAVDDAGYFEGVTDGRGGLEPRFSCNVVFEQGEKIYDAINTIAGIFRGRAFFANSEVNFVDDRPRSPVNLFTNESVKDGMFFYANNRRDEQYNTIEVGFKDRFDNFAPKIEVIENEEDIRQRGVFKNRIKGVGITSRAMARRVGQHQIFSKITENQTVAFTAGLETLLCQPGDLISIEDELKTNKSNFGKILAVNLEDETIRLSNTFVSADMTGRLTVFNPTGRNTLTNMEEEVAINRQRYESFTITGSADAPADMWASGHTSYTGGYTFSGYTLGYEGATRSETEDEERFEEYALYTGEPVSTSTDYPYIYFETGVTGWIFASGVGGEDDGLPDARSLFSGAFISQLTGMQTLLDFGTGNITVLDMGEADKRSDPTTDPDKVAAFSGFDDSSFSPSMPSSGPWNRELPSVLGPNQMTVLSVTGGILSTPSELEASGLNPYGSLASGFDKPELLPFLKLGSPAKFEIKDASPFIYKVVSMKEEAPNAYLVSATKYETGKFKLIEDNVSIEHEANTYSYQSAQTINGTTYTTLDTPEIDVVTTGVPDPISQTFNITGRWGEVSNSTGYNVILTYPNGQTTDTFTTSTGHSFTGLTQVGVFNYGVNSLGNKAASLTNGYFDSQYDTSGLFVVYDELLIWNTNFLNRITII